MSRPDLLHEVTSFAHLAVQILEIRLANGRLFRCYLQFLVYVVLREIRIAWRKERL